MSFFTPQPGGSQPVLRGSSGLPGASVEELLRAYDQQVYEHKRGVTQFSDNVELVSNAWNKFITPAGNVTFVYNENGTSWDPVARPEDVNALIEKHADTVLNIVFSKHRATRLVMPQDAESVVAALNRELYDDRDTIKRYANGLALRAQTAGAWLEYSFAGHERHGVLANKLWVCPDAKMELKDRFFMGFEEVLEYFREIGTPEKHKDVRALYDYDNAGGDDDEDEDY